MSHWTDKPNPEFEQWWATKKAAGYQYGREALENVRFGFEGAQERQWQDIKTAPKDGSEIVCWAKDFQRPCFLRWKINPRIIHAHSIGQNLELATSYFGDPDEMDDYNLAVREGGPTHWMPLPDPPSLEQAGSS